MLLRARHHLKLLASHNFDHLLFIKITSFWRPILHKLRLTRGGLRQIRMSSSDKVMADASSIPGSEVKTIASSSVVEISATGEKETTTHIPVAETPMSSDDQANVQEQDEEVKPQKVTPNPEVVNPRGYQREMLEQSIKRNVIVAVSYSEYPIQSAFADLIRWTREVVKLKCMSLPYHRKRERLIITRRAVMRIQHELDTCAPDKVGEQRNIISRSKLTNIDCLVLRQDSIAM